MVHQHGDHHDIPHEHKVHRPGAWLPADHRIQKEWLGKQIEHADKNPKELVPVLQDFKDFIEMNPRIYMYFNSMFDEVPVKKPYNKDPTGHKQIRDYHHMLQILNHTFTTAPHWTDAAANVGMVGVPMCAIFDYPMGTASGYAAFLDPDVNAHLKKILNEWGKFLTSPKSAEVLGDHKQGWFGPTGINDIMEVANAPYKTQHKFEDFFVCDPKAKHHGYKSWDHYFTRQFRDEVRPVASPEDDNVIANACESKVFNVAHNVKLRDRFWIKGQPYSVRDMLAQDPLAENFAGGTVYQAFLSALSYHRWHAPVSGTIKKAFVQDGTYFSEPLFEGLGDPQTEEIDRGGISTGQGYLTALATRAVIFIEADNPAIGLMAFIGVGMDEVSTCEITVKEGQHVKKGEQTGMFHFGGSSHVLLFRKGVKVEGFPQPGRSENVPVRSQVAVVKP
ncbi:Phosphatidylserine decarboxylase proenzyme 3 [Teratosphaeria destructans]|uniref:Phosphatidylserine decarboxylase proenzyme 3 n=1 Tax=Teratosphaeria destructans TaxID=418781 RepID=A0A9W7W764_9PEZI|nr:Phosphatidylserine decarboxylase proenzyme 3 [Teratosphaeria destructans]